jgi:hypothetical protein
MSAQSKDFAGGLLLSQVLFTVAYLGVRFAFPRIFADRYLSDHAADDREKMVAELTECGMREVLILGPLHFIGICLGFVLLRRKIKEHAM